MILARCTGTLRIRLSCLLIHFVWTELVPVRTGTGGTDKPPCNCIHRCMTMRKYVCMCSMPHLLAKITESNFICFGCSYTFFSHDHRKHLKLVQRTPWSMLLFLPMVMNYAHDHKLPMQFVLSSYFIHAQSDAAGRKEEVSANLFMVLPQNEENL